ncbi:MAG: hypothetical protein NZ700_16500 [Gemmataceae bacterium]|nr:hypothetical protein [Gemmataceae bacterium]MDW8264336.1 hypothetical protein [Gemmataceae bacterium]
MRKRDAEAACRYLERALQIDPLDRQLRQMAFMAHAERGSSHARGGRFDTARQAFAAALSWDEEGSDWVALCKWAACEFKAGNPDRAEELLGQVQARCPHPLPWGYLMSGEANALGLPSRLKQRFQSTLEAGLREPPTAEALSRTVLAVLVLRQTGTTYQGQKSHEQKVLMHVEQAREQVTFAQEQLLALCQMLKAIPVSETKMIR